MVGELILNHQCSLWNQHDEAKPIAYLDLSIGSHQMEVFAPTDEDLAQGRLIQDAEMESPKNMPKRKRNNCVIITGHCTLINYKEGTKRIKYDFCLTAIIYLTKAKEQKQSDSNKQEKEQGMRYRDTKVAAKVLDMSGSMKSWLNSRIFTKADIKVILWKA